MATVTGVTLTVFCVLVTLFFLVGVPLLVIYSGRNSFENPTFTVESTVVKAYNLTSDDILFCIINFGIRANNPNPKKHSFDFSGLDMELRKGKHHKLADDALLGFNVGRGGGVLVDVEAVGLNVGMERKIAAEVRADVVAGEGRVNVFMSGHLWSKLYYLDVTCMNVAVDFSRSTVRFQEVLCTVTMKSPKSRNDDDAFDY